VYIDKERKQIKAGIEKLSGYSAHADQKGLLDWVQAMGDLSGKIRLVHGEYAAKRGLKFALRECGINKQGFVG
jgi:metallo-beta-lactamase family protein